MQKRRLGRTDIYVPPVVFGAWAIHNFGYGSTEINKAIESLRKAYELGFNTVDTAPVYSMGLSEEVVAEAYKDFPRDSYQLFTKCGTSWKPKKSISKTVREMSSDEVFDNYEFYSDNTKEEIIVQCENSLKRLNTDYLDLYSLHWPDSITPIEEIMEAFEILIAQGKIKAAGLCNHSMSELKTANNILNVAAHKIRYSILNRGIETDMVPYCIDNQVGMLVYSVLQRGLLDNYFDRHFIWSPKEENPRELALYKPKNIELIKLFFKSLNDIADDYGLTAQQLCVNWTVSQPAITAALIGATSIEDVTATVNAVNTSVDENGFEQIKKKLEDLELKLDLSEQEYTYDYEEGIVHFKD